MSEKAELAGYLSDLLCLMDAKEDVGLHRGHTLGREYGRAYDRLVEIIRKEEEDETRTSTEGRGKSQGRAKVEGR
jgi:hypothetical protein